VVAFLKAINVGGHTVSMDRLRALFEGLGLQNVETFIASGNVVFESRARSLAGLERRIGQAVRAALGYAVPTFLRTAGEVAAVAARPPFPPTRIAGAGACNVGFLARAPGKRAAEALLALSTRSDELHLRGREIYWLSRTNLSASRLSYAAIERALGTEATFRGMNTITRLVAKFGFREPR
jgi:uncharacterized protein (DUF1697 family)